MLQLFGIVIYLFMFLWYVGFSVWGLGVEFVLTFQIVHLLAVAAT